MTKKLYKVTCTSQTYTHYWVKADNAEQAEENYCNFEKCQEDASYGDNDEEVLEVTEVKKEEEEGAEEIHKQAVLDHQYENLEKEEKNG